MKKYFLLLLIFIPLNLCAQSEESNFYFEEGVKLYEIQNYYDAAAMFALCDSLDTQELAENSTRRHYARMWLTACIIGPGYDGRLRDKYFKDKDREWSNEFHEYPPIDRRKTIVSDKFAQKGIDAYNAGNLKEAIENYSKCAQAEKEVLGDSCWYYANTLLNLGNLFSQYGDLAEARKYYISAVEVFKKNYDHGLGVCGYLKALLNTNQFCSKYKIYPELQNSTHKKYIEILGEASMLYILYGDMEKVELYDSLHVKMTYDSFGDTSIEFSNALFQRSLVLHFLWVLTGEEDKEWLDREKVSIETSIDIMEIINNNDYNDEYIKRLIRLYDCYTNLGYNEKLFELKNKIDTYLRKQSIVEQFCLKVKYYKSILISQDLNSKKIFYKEMVDFAREHKLTETLEYAQLLDNLAILYAEQRDWDNYETISLQALILKKDSLSTEQYIKEEEHIYQMITILNQDNLEARLHATIRLAEIEYAKNGESLDYAIRLKNIANTYMVLGLTSEAVNILYEVLDLYHKFGAKENDIKDIESILRGRIMSSIDALLEDRERVFKEERQSDKYIDLTEKIYYKYRYEQKDYEQAIQELNVLINHYKTIYNSNVFKSEILKWELHKAYCLYELIPNENHNYMIDSLFTEYNKTIPEKNQLYNREKYDEYVSYAGHQFLINNYKLAIKWFEEAIALYPFVTEIDLHKFLYLAYRYDGQIESAELAFKHFCDIVMSDIHTKVPYMNVNERWRYWKNQESNLMRISRYAWKNPSQVTCAEAYNSLLVTKGFMLMTEVTLKKHIINLDNVELLNLYNDIIQTKRNLTILKQQPDNNDTLVAMERELHTKELQLMKDSTIKGYAEQLFIDWKTVRNSLNDRDIAIEFVDREFYNGERTLLAFVLKKQYEYPRVLEMPGFIECCDSMIMAQANNLSGISLLYQNDSLYDKFWGVLADELKDVDNVFFSPDGILNMFAIENLSKSNDNLLASKKLYRLTSTREITSIKVKQIQQATLYGGLNYQMPNSNKLSKNEYVMNRQLSRRSAVLNDCFLTELEATKNEIESIRNLLLENNIKVTMYTGENGTEDSFWALSNGNSSIIHIATHGTYLSKQDVSISNYESEDLAMTRSCLYLSGVEDACSQNSSFINYQVNGILTATEIASLDLKLVDLVVLSACETGLGDVTPEGVFGLQRGFKKAGVNSILMSLWKVDDNATCFLMTEFYKYWLSGKSKYESLELAKQNVRAQPQWQDPKYWAAFILLDALN